MTTTAMASLIVPVSIFLAVQRFRHDKSLPWPPPSGSNLGLLLLAPSFLAYLFFYNDRAYYLAAFAMIGMIGGLVWTLWGDNTARRLAFPIAYLVFMIPLPFIERWTLPLAMFTGVCSGAAVQFIGLDIEIIGNSVSLPNADLVIGAQCSGINSLIALMALAVLAAYLVDGPPWARTILVLLSFPLAMLGNILRVASLLIVARFYGADSAFTFYHDYSGPIFFLISLALLDPGKPASGLQHAAFGRHLSARRGRGQLLQQAARTSERKLACNMIGDYNPSQDLVLKQPAPKQEEPADRLSATVSRSGLNA